MRIVSNFMANNYSGCCFVNVAWAKTKFN